MPSIEPHLRNGSSCFDCCFWVWGQDPDLGLPLGPFIAFVLCLAEGAGSLSAEEMPVSEGERGLVSCGFVALQHCSVDGTWKGLWDAKEQAVEDGGAMAGLGFLSWCRQSASELLPLPSPPTPASSRPTWVLYFPLKHHEGAGRKPGPRRWRGWWSRVAVRVGEPWGLTASPPHSRALRAHSERAACPPRSSSSVWSPPPRCKTSLHEKSKTCLRSTLWPFFFPHICAQISYFARVALYQLGNPACFSTPRCALKVRIYGILVVVPASGKGAGSENGRGGVSVTAGEVGVP